MLKIDVSIIIVNYNSFQLIINLLESIQKFSKDISIEAIIVDNNSPDVENLIDLQNTDKYPFIKLVSLPENIGFGRANNEGIKIAKGRNVFFLNPDTLLLNNSIKILSDYLDSHIKVGACGGNLYNESMMPTRSFKRYFPSLKWVVGHLFLLNLLDVILFGKNRFFNNTNKELLVAYIVGADLMVKRELLDSIGYFNPAFFMYYEEIELCNRIYRAGYQIVSVPESKIQHLEGKSTKNLERKARMHFESFNNYFRLTHNFYYCLIIRFVHFFTIMSRLVVFGLLKRPNYLYWKVQLNCYFKFDKG